MTRSLIRRWFVPLLVSLLVGLYCVVSPAVPTKSSQVEVFEQAWQTVKDNFYDPKFNGVDWQAVRQKYQPQAAKAQSTAAIAPVINAMLKELNASHTYFYTQADPAYYQLSAIFRRGIEEKQKPFLPNGKLQYTGIGAFTKDISGKTFVTGVLEGSAAAKAGLVVGDQLLSADNQPFQPITSFANKAGQRVNLQVQRTANPASVQTIAVTPQVLDPAAMFLDAMKASAQIIERDGKKIGYVHIWSYADQAYQDQLERELTEGRLKNVDSLIWDLRDGWGGASPDYLSLFTASVPSVIMTGRDGKPYRYDSQWKKPVVMLVNQGSRSGKEILAYGFRKFRVGSIVGSTTAGAVLAGRAYIMNDGSLLYVAVADVQVDGDRLEGKGVTPDVEVQRTIEYAQGADPQKDRAIQVAL
ncbi:PDZ domain-containing protein, partial [Leptolyngbya sp. FACHB-36]|uniref:S41 family peptidase n=1 Tax=Leptolyngbya sp. FACHB-36 TaxID=2692808 RepID=UPI001680B479